MEDGDLASPLSPGTWDLDPVHSSASPSARPYSDERLTIEVPVAAPNGSSHTDATT
jgi:hypothetical protein